MFTILNRLRGTWGWMAKVTAIILGGTFYLFTQDLYTSVGIAVGYLAGESFGWGKWFGGIYFKNKTSDSIKAEDEGVNNGVHWLANKLMPQDKDFYKYSILALALRGTLWVALTTVALVIGGYISIGVFVVTALLLGIGFPLSVKLGIKTEKYFKFKFMDGWWEHSEVWYGIMQDIVLLAVLLSITL